MRISKHIAAICLGLGISISALAQRDALLDLTKQRVKSRSETISGSVGGTNHQNSRPTTPPLKLSLMSLDKQQYELGEQFIYEVSIENIGDQPLLLPWEPDREKVAPKPTSAQAGLRQMSLSLSIEELDGDAIFGAQNIYGSESVPGSLQKLLPGRKARIRIPGGWYLGTQDLQKRVLPLLPRLFTVKAKLGLEYQKNSATERYAPLFSNSRPVEMKKRT